MLKYSQLVGFFCTMKTINEQINPAFISQAKKLTQIKRLLDQILPVDCHIHYQVANIRQQILMLITDSPVWTTRLRQLSPKILQYINENSQKFETCLNIHKQSTKGASSLQNDSNHDLKTNIVRNSKPIIHHIQITTRYHSQNNGNNNLKRQNTSKPEISNKTAELLSQSANSIEHPHLKNALKKLAQHGKTKPQ